VLASDHDGQITKPSYKILR